MDHSEVVKRSRISKLLGREGICTPLQVVQEYSENPLHGVVQALAMSAATTYKINNRRKGFTLYSRNAWIGVVLSATRQT
jgi:hypothetical protein